MRPCVYASTRIFPLHVYAVTVADVEGALTSRRPVSLVWLRPAQPGDSKLQQAVDTLTTVLERDGCSLPDGNPAVAAVRSGLLALQPRLVIGVRLLYFCRTSVVLLL